MDKTEEKHTYIHLANSTNSTMFTDCCGCAVLNSEIKCPCCNATVYGSEAETDYERGRIRWNYAFCKQY